MKKLILPVLAASLVVAACSSSDGSSDATTPTLATTSTEVATTMAADSPTSTVVPSPDEIAAAEREADIDRIDSLFSDYSAAWFVSLEAATTYIAEHVYPSLGCTPESALETFGGVEGQRESIVVLEDTIERADGWTMPSGPTAGEPVEGRIYLFVTETTVSVPGLDDVVTQDKAHATVIGDDAHFFFECWDIALDG